LVLINTFMPKSILTILIDLGQNVYEYKARTKEARKNYPTGRPASDSDRQKQLGEVESALEQKHEDCENILWEARMIR
jgi:hypothetical protein